MSKYLRIADDLRERIVDGSYEPGRRLPSNRELADAYGTTLATLRAALQLLADQGWVTVEHGNGTFVADVGADADMLVSLTEQAVGAGVTLETRVHGIETGVEDGEVARLLEVRPPRNLVRLDRLRLVGGAPAVFQSSYLASEHAVLLESYDGTQPLYRFLRLRAGSVPVHSRERLTAVALPEAAADALQAPPGRAALRSHRLSSSHEGRPIVVDEAFVLTDVLEVVVDRHGRSTAASFRPAGGQPDPVEVRDAG